MSGTSIFVLIVLLVFAAILTGLVRRFARRRSVAHVSLLPYRKRGHLCSPAERSFLGVLDRAVGNEYRIFAKVRVADVLAVESGGDRASRQRTFNRISAKHFDFVLCAPGDLAIVAAIELDDGSHDRDARKARDDLVGSAASGAGLTLLRFPAQRAYSIAELREAITLRIAPLEAPAAPRENAY